jgi:hypothetical protein
MASCDERAERFMSLLGRRNGVNAAIGALETQFAGGDLLVERAVEHDERLPRRIVKKDGVAAHARIEPLAHKIELAVLEGCCDLDAILEAQEQGPRIGRQPPRQMLAKLGKV